MTRIGIFKKNRYIVNISKIKDVYDLNKSGKTKKKEIAGFQKPRDACAIFLHLKAILGPQLDKKG